jgi:hypothetical protein
VTSSTRYIRSISPAVVALAVLALVLGGAGVGYSAGKIGTKDIKSNAVTGAKVKNGTLTDKDMVKDQQAIKVADPGGVDFSDGGQGDCIWQSGALVLPGVGDPTYRTDRFGTVHLSGIAVGTSGPGGDAMCDSSGEVEDGLVMVLPPELRPASTILIQTGLNTLYVMGPTPIPPLVAGAVYASDGVAFLDGISYLPSTSPLAPKAPARTQLGPEGRALLHRLGLR